MINVYNFEPCKARAELKSLFKRSKQLTFEAKLDGGRYLLANFNGEPTLTGRRSSVKTKQKLNKIDHFPALKEMMQKMQMQGWFVDGEIMHPKGFRQVISIMNSLPDRAFEEQVTHGNLEYYVFDVIHAPEVGNVSNEPLSTRREYLAAFMQELYDKFDDADRYIRHIPILGNYNKDSDPLYETFERYIGITFDFATSLGHEGLIVKNMSGHIHQQQWAKIKASETWDFVIIGYDDSDSMMYKGLGIAALQLGLYDKSGACIPVCKCSGMTDEWRMRFYENKEDYLYKTVEIGGQLMHEDTGAIRHPRFIRMRPDVDEHEQTFEKYGVKRK